MWWRTYLACSECVLMAWGSGSRCGGFGGGGGGGYSGEVCVWVCLQVWPWGSASWLRNEWVEMALLAVPSRV